MKTTCTRMNAQDSKPVEQVHHQLKTCTRTEHVEPQTRLNKPVMYKAITFKLNLKRIQRFQTKPDHKIYICKIDIKTQLHHNPSTKGEPDQNTNQNQVKHLNIKKQHET